MTINYRFALDTNELDDNEVGLGAQLLNVERFTLDASPLNDEGFALDGDQYSFKVVGSADSEAGGLVAQASGEIIVTVVAIADANLGEGIAEATVNIQHGAIVESSFGELTASISGEIDNPATGEALLGEATAQASAIVSHFAQGTSEFETLSASGEGVVIVSASGVTIVPALDASANGLVIPIGSANATLGSLDASASATVISRGSGGGVRWLQQLPPKPIVIVKDVVEETEAIVVEREPVSVFATASVRFPVLRARAIGSVSWVAERDDEEVLLLL